MCQFGYRYMKGLKAIIIESYYYKNVEHLQKERLTESHKTSSNS